MDDGAICNVIHMYKVVKWEIVGDASEDVDDAGVVVCHAVCACV